MKKWREKNWRGRGGCEHLEKGEENLTGRKNVRNGRSSGFGKSYSRVGKARGHHGSEDGYGRNRGWGVRGGMLKEGESTGRGSVGGVRAGKTGTMEVGKSGVFTEKGVSAAEPDDGLLGEETDDRLSAAETDDGMSAAETDDGLSGAGTDDGARPAKDVPLVASVEEDFIFGSKKGYPTDRRPSAVRRELSETPVEVIEAWFAAEKIPVGETVQKDPKKMERVRRLLYTWKDVFITHKAKMVGTVLVVHTIPTWENAVLVRAKAKHYTPKERKWMEANILKLFEADIIEHSFSQWSHRTKFVPKKDGDLHMVHV